MRDITCAYYIHKFFISLNDLLGLYFLIKAFFKKIF